ncbi:PIN domain protein [Thiothrix subterranea]|uniref:PIN domain protein n=1 Tax=Thiothrix subterranea TaxID=2735563 RepID=UPI00192C8BF4|nr:PIN domain protein [Thiothrix subterranea]QQZ30588.1 PIN domain protein [Thiothrix subterranea]
MKLYLDNCMFNRPFDDQSNLKVLLESEAKLRIQENIRSGIYELVWSYILDYENNKNPFLERKEQIGKWKLYAHTDIEEDETIINLAKSINQLGLKKFDSLHIACAIKANSDYFLTTDIGIIKKANIVKTIKIKDPIDFIREVFA